MMVFLKRVLFALILAAVVVFAIQGENLEAMSQTIQFHLKVWDIWHLYTTPAFPIALLFLVFFLLGMLTAGFHGVYEHLARRVDVRKRNKRIRQLEEEIGALRSQVAELKPPPRPEEPPREPAPERPAGASPEAAPTKRLAEPEPAPTMPEEEPTL